LSCSIYFSVGSLTFNKTSDANISELFVILAPASSYLALGIPASFPESV
jgi:hypothetical protein